MTSDRYQYVITPTEYHGPETLASTFAVINAIPEDLDWITYKVTNDFGARQAGLAPEWLR